MQASAPATTMRGKRFVFTINNYDDQLLIDLPKLVEDPELNHLTPAQAEAVGNISILVVEKEVGEEGTPHLQGYVEFKERVYRRVLESILGRRAWIDTARGSTSDNIIYCTKEAKNDPSAIVINYIEPRRRRQTQRALENKTKKTGDEKARDILTDMKEMTEDDFIAAHPSYYLYNQSKYLTLRHAMMIKDDLPTYDGELQAKNYWIYGPTGTGKSKFARNDIKNIEIFSHPINKWWNGYTNQKRVIFDDYPSGDKGNMWVDHMKVWADRYPFTAEAKGSHIFMTPNNYELVITSNFKIEECFKDPDDVAALKRRFRVIPFQQGDDARYISISHLRQQAEENQDSTVED